MKSRTLLAVAALCAAALVAPGAPATAVPLPAPAPAAVAVPAAKPAPAKLTLKKLKAVKVLRGAKATIKPSYAKKGKVRVLSARVSVWRGKKAIAKNKTKVSVAAGTYKVKQTVTYRLRAGSAWGKKRTASLTQTLKVSSRSAKYTYATTAEREMLRIMNADRAKLKLPKLKSSAALTKAFERATMHEGVYGLYANGGIFCDVLAGDFPATISGGKRAARTCIDMIKDSGEYKRLVLNKRIRYGLALVFVDQDAYKGSYGAYFTLMTR